MFFSEGRLENDGFRTAISALEEAGITFAVICFENPPQPLYQQGLGDTIKSSPMVLACPNLLIFEEEDKPVSFDVLRGPILDWLHTPTVTGNRRLMLEIFVKNGFCVTDFINALYQVIIYISCDTDHFIFIVL
jgi:hypothetical protein